jgi:hypothetical protein
VNFLPGAIDSEKAAIVVDRAPGRQVVRQQPPGAARAVEVQNAVDHLAHVHLAVPAAWFLRGDMRFDQQPLFIREIAGVWIPFHAASLLEV